MGEQWSLSKQILLTFQGLLRPCWSYTYIWEKKWNYLGWGFLTWKGYFNFCLVLPKIINGSQQGHLSIKSHICWAYQKQRSACSLSITVHLELTWLFPPKQYYLSASNSFLWLSCHCCVANMAKTKDICSTFPSLCHHRRLCQVPIPWSRLFVAIVYFSHSFAPYVQAHSSAVHSSVSLVLMPLFLSGISTDSYTLYHLSIYKGPVASFSNLSICLRSQK